jgi:hypothetical protein
MCTPQVCFCAAMDIGPKIGLNCQGRKEKTEGEMEVKEGAREKKRGRGEMRLLTWETRLSARVSGRSFLCFFCATRLMLTVDR